MGPGVVLVSSADETAFDVRATLLESGLYRRGGGTGQRRWISSGEPSAFVLLGQQLFGPELDEAEHWAPPPTQASVPTPSVA
jgi:glutamate racemase